MLKILWGTRVLAASHCLHLCSKACGQAWNTLSNGFFLRHGCCFCSIKSRPRCKCYCNHCNHCCTRERNGMWFHANSRRIGAPEIDSHKTKQAGYWPARNSLVPCKINWTQRTLLRVVRWKGYSRKCIMRCQRISQHWWRNNSNKGWGGADCCQKERDRCTYCINRNEIAKNLWAGNFNCANEEWPHWQ